jgi:hypothetical protein
VIGAQGQPVPHRFRARKPGDSIRLAQAGAATACVTADTSATELCDRDAGLWRLQREALPKASVVLDRWRAAVCFEPALQAARGLGKADARLAAEAVRGWSLRSGDCGTGVGRNAGANSPS